MPRKSTRSIVAALRRRPGDPQLLRRLAAAQLEEGDCLAAYRTAQQLLKSAPDDVGMLLLAGEAALAGGAPPQAGRCFERAARCAPTDPRPRTGLGRTAYELGYDAAAAEQLEAAIGLDAGAAEAWHWLGRVRKRQARPEQAAAAFERALALDPASPACGGLLMVRREQCDWRDHGSLLRRTERALDRAIASGDPAPITPSFGQKIPLSPRRMLELNRNLARRLLQRTAGLRRQLGAPPRRTGDVDRLRVAYLSDGFRDFPQGHLLRDLFRHHDRERFEILAYHFGADDGSVWRRDIEAGVERFVDVASQPTEAIVRRIRADAVDVLVDLKGFSSGNRPDIALLRPAPIQVNWLGFPGSWGSAEVMDYLLADRIVVPPGEERCYDEAIVRLPGCYAPADPAARRAGPGRATRAAHRLPEDAFVACTFNGPDKLGPETLADWAELVHHAPRALLWLYAPSDAVRAGLGAAVEAAGIPATRVRYADRLGKAEHLDRLALADLFLDSQPYGAHTTASDALLAGVPLLTWPGATFAGRVATSVLTAAGLPELVCPGRAEALARAAALARGEEPITPLRAAVAERLPGSRLLDGAAFARGLERAFLGMWSRHREGLPPAGFDVEP